MWPFLALIYICLSISFSLNAKKPERPIVVETMLVKPEKFILKRRFIGTIKAENFSILSAKSNSTVSKIHVSAEQAVKKGQLLVSLLSTSSHSQLTLAKQKLDLLTRELERETELFKSQDITQAQLDKTKREWLEASHAVEQSKRYVENIEIRAPFDGVVGVPRVVNGESLTVGQSVISIKKGYYLVTFQVPPARLRELSIGQKVELVQESNIAPKQVLSSMVKAIEHSIDPKTRTGFAEASFLHCDGCLVGESVFIYVTVAENPHAILLNKSAIYYDKGKAFCVAVKYDKAKQASADIRELVLGSEQDGLIEILSGLKAGELIVRADPKRLSQDAKLRVAP